MRGESQRAKGTRSSAILQKPRTLRLTEIEYPARYIGWRSEWVSHPRKMGVQWIRVMSMNADPSRRNFEIKRFGVAPRFYGTFTDIPEDERAWFFDYKGEYEHA